MNCTEYRQHCIQKAEEERQKRLDNITRKVKEKFPIIEDVLLNDGQRPYCKICGQLFYIKEDPIHLYITDFRPPNRMFTSIFDEADLGEYFKANPIKEDGVSFWKRFWTYLNSLN